MAVFSPLEQMDLAELIVWAREFAKIDEEDARILEREKFSGHRLLRVTADELRSAGMKAGPARGLLTARDDYLKRARVQKIRLQKTAVVATAGVLSGMSYAAVQQGASTARGFAFFSAFGAVAATLCVLLYTPSARSIVDGGGRGKR